MDDMISRQAAIRTIADTECEYDISPYIKDERTEEQKRKDWFDMCKVLFRQIIEDLPSAQPIDVQEAYYRGKIDGIKECTTRLKKMNDEVANGRHNQQTSSQAS